MREEAKKEVEDLDLTHNINHNIEGSYRTKDHKVRINRVVACGTPDLYVSHDNNHAVNVCSCDPEGAGLAILVVDRVRSLHRAEGDNLKGKGLASAVEDPPPESVFSEVQVLKANLEMPGISEKLFFKLFLVKKSVPHDWECSEKDVVQLIEP
jgi:hypothetical protein